MCTSFSRNLPNWCQLFCFFRSSGKYQLWFLSSFQIFFDVTYYTDLTLQITLYLRKSTINCQTNTTTLITPGNIMIIRATIEMTTSHSWCRCWNWWQMGNVQYLLYWVPWYLLCHQFFRQIHSKRHCHTSEILNYPLSNIVTFTTFYSNFFVNWNFSLLKATEDCHHSWYH